jgi:hypothetical protein
MLEGTATSRSRLVAASKEYRLVAASKEYSMRKKTTRGRSPMRARAALYAVGTAILTPSPEIPFTQPRGQAEAADGIDRPFFRWILAGLIAASVAAGAIAMSGVVRIIPSS